MSAITVLFGLIFGALLALLRKNRLGIPFGKKKFYPIRFLAVAYIEIIRGTPTLLQLYFFYFLLPMLFPILYLSKFTCVMVSLIFYFSAYVSDVIRFGFYVFVL